jgi:hypothetical protein
MFYLLRLMVNFVIIRPKKRLITTTVFSCVILFYHILEYIGPCKHIPSLFYGSYSRRVPTFIDLYSVECFKFLLKSWLS